MSDMNFEQMLAQHNQAYKDAQEYSSWMPPDDEYTVTVVKCDKGVSNKDGKDFQWWKLTARIEAVEDESLNGKEFALGFYSTNAMGILKGQAKALNKGETPGSLVEADQVFESAVGEILSVKVVTSEKSGYTNCYVQEVLATEDPAGQDGAEQEANSEA